MTLMCSWKGNSTMKIKANMTSFRQGLHQVARQKYHWQGTFSFPLAQVFPQELIFASFTAALSSALKNRQSNMFFLH